MAHVEGQEIPPEFRRLYRAALTPADPLGRVAGRKRFHRPVPTGVGQVSRGAFRDIFRSWRVLSHEEREPWREQARELGLPAQALYIKHHAHHVYAWGPFQVGYTRLGSWGEVLTSYVAGRDVREPDAPRAYPQALLTVGWTPVGLRARIPPHPAR